jgi:hypothetical protein
MPRPKIQCEAVTLGQLAKRWGIAPKRARKLANQQPILKAFKIPSSGTDGEAVRIPIAAVLNAQQEWTLHPEDNPLLERPQRRQRNGHSPKLKHFPELNTEPEDGAAQFPEDASD